MFLQALNVVASEVMVGDTCIPSLIVINNTINQLETNIPYSGYFTWGLNFVVFVVGKQNTKISDTKIKCTV